MKLQKISLIVGTFVLVLAFQNCGKVNFSSTGTALTTTNGGTPSGEGVVSTDVPSGNPIPTSTAAGNPPDNPPPTTTTGNDPGTKSCSKDPGGADENEGDVVECDLGSSNSKIVVGNVLSSGASNSSNSRICVSRNACLALINNYAKVRGCSLSLGAVTTPSSTASCTSVFPGSKGTCKNAQIVSDATIASILAAMGNSK